MLYNTFQHLPRIGHKTEERLWEDGITDWGIVRELPEEIIRMTPIVPELIEDSFERVRTRDSGWFSRLLPPAERWRMFGEFRNSVAYIDIETNGRGHKAGGEITTICLWDGTNLKTYVQGENLKNFQDDILDYRLLVTYNGASFDLPFIESWFNTTLPHGHIDLRYVLAGLGVRGGLKSCEEQMGLSRGDLAGVDGEYAVHLWNRYRMFAEQSVLDTLVAYNAMDVITLEQLMFRAYNLKLAEMHLISPRILTVPEQPPLPCAPPSIDVIEEIRDQIEERRDGMRGLVRSMLSGDAERYDSARD